MRKKKAANYSQGFVIALAVFAIVLILIGLNFAFIAMLLVILGAAGWQINKAIQVKKAYEHWFHNSKGKENILAMDPLEFEKFVEELFRQNGYKVRSTARSGDEGIDLFLEKESVAYVAQIKKTARPIGSDPMRTFIGSMAHAGIRHGIYVSISGYTSEARRQAHGKNIILLDIDNLEALLPKN